MATAKWREDNREHARAYARNHYGKGLNNLRCRWKQMQYRSERAGREFPLTFDAFEQWWKETPSRCAYCGIRQKYLVQAYPSAHATKTRDLTVDRIDNALPYQIGNLTKACWQCNTIKGDTFSFAEMKQIGELIQWLIVKRFS